ncbi:MAG TPA: hypothetical protein VFO84_01540 [Dehalococcoidia bacterium]|nr:hypothetical protein [Dehalococcoidia bacterium]
MSPALLVVSGLTLALGAIVTATVLLAADNLDDDESARIPAATATPEPTPSASEEFIVAFQPLGCDLQDFSNKLTSWTAEVQTRGDRLEILGGIGFWREILAGIQPRIDDLPADQRELRAVATDYIVAVDLYLANLGEYWFTAQQQSGDAAANQLLVAEEQRALLQAEAEEAAGGPFALSCPQPAPA